MSEVIQIEQHGTEVAPITPMQMLQTAVDKGADIDQLTKLMDLQERWEANEARKFYIVAMSAFKANPPEITKNKDVHYSTSKGDTDYSHATLDHVANAISTAMSPHGLSFRWSVDQGDAIRVGCFVTHVNGHSEEVWLQAPADQSGGKNSIQAIGSTVTYLQRYTLLAATGLAAKGQDNDGSSADQSEPITLEQVATLLALAEEVKADMPKLMTYLKVESLGELPSHQYDHAVKAMEAKRK